MNNFIWLEHYDPEVSTDEVRIDRARSAADATGMFRGRPARG